LVFFSASRAARILAFLFSSTASAEFLEYKTLSARAAYTVPLSLYCFAILSASSFSLASWALFLASISSRRLYWARATDLVLAGCLTGAVFLSDLLFIKVA